MTTARDPAGAINGNGASDPDSPSKTPDISIRAAEESPLPDHSYFPNTLPPAVVAQNEAGGENVGNSDINKLAFKRDPPVARGPYFSTQVE